MHETKEVIEKEKILESALHCFERFGPDKTTLADIAQNLGYSRTKIYYYFKDKESVSKAVLLKMSKKYFEEQENIVATAENAVVALEKLLQNRIRYSLEIYTKGVFSLAFTQELMENDEELALILEKEHKLYAKVLKKGVKENVFDVKNITFNAQIILDSVGGYFQVLSSRYKNPKAISAHLKEIKEHTNAQIKFIIQSIYKHN